MVGARRTQEYENSLWPQSERGRRPDPDETRLDPGTVRVKVRLGLGRVLMSAASIKRERWIDHRRRSSEQDQMT